jgi:hypothetical protein
MWRKDYDFLRVFKSSEIVGFDPQVDEWEPTYANIEAAVLAKASVVVIRIENNELLNGSLGSIAEIGMALASAALRGQIVIVSIEDDLVTTLNEPGAIAQYMMLELSLEHLDRIADLTRFLRVHRGNDLRELAQISCRAVEEQKQGCIERVDYAEFLRETLCWGNTAPRGRRSRSCLKELLPKPGKCPTVTSTTLGLAWPCVRCWRSKPSSSRRPTYYCCR